MGKADSRSPRWRHSLPFSAKFPGELHEPFWHLSCGLSGRRMHLLQRQVQQGGLLTTCQVISAELGCVLPGTQGGKGTFLASAQQD